MDPENSAATQIGNEQLGSNLLNASGEMEPLIRSFDWSSTPIGAPDIWSTALRTMVRILLANRFPMLLWWGPDYISIYNDAYSPILGRKHPWGLGRPVRECWSEIWDVLKPLIDTPYKGGPSTWIEDIELQINRSGFVEETHFTIAYSPVPDEAAPSGIGGVLATVHEITEKVIGARRALILRDLGACATEAKTAEEALANVAATLEKHRKDIPFALLYLLDAHDGMARLVASTGAEITPEMAPPILDVEDEQAAWPLAEAYRTKEMAVVPDLAERFPAVPPGTWADPPQTGVVIPIRSNTPRQTAGFLVAGLSARLKLDDAYRSFLDLATAQIASAIASARAYEEERKRTEALMEIDRAKTAFFSNVSHEFRTPLTLMLGPLENVLAAQDTVKPEAREQIATAHRNSLRLLKLVNSLLDFSRIEAGRVKASYVPVDLAELTRDISSNFRSAVEAAGLQFSVDCPPLSQLVYVDREMWEKIVLNLLSNAFKFTLEGRITVKMEASNQAVLTVADTGTGIPPTELPHVFERFHRVEGAKGRTYEGTGIGLALIQELVRLHGGTISAESRLGEGSSFAVAIPFGTDHLPQDRIGTAPIGEASNAVRSEAYTGEAETWLARERLAHPSEELPAVALQAGPRPRILLADDNADMREHVSRILGGGYEVISVANGVDALKAAHDEAPDLILTDVMMPGLDGFGLLRELRNDTNLREVPVVMLSARAGEEARTEGIHAGADDYLTKPFRADELVARVETTLKLQRTRSEARDEIARSEERFRAFVTATSDVVYRMNADWTEMLHLRGRDFIADTQDPSHGWLEKYIHPDDQRQVMAAIQKAIAAKTRFELEHRVIRLDGSLGWTVSRAIPILNSRDDILEWFGTARDVTERRLSEEAIATLIADAEQERRLYHTILASTPDLVYVFDRNHCFSYANEALLRMWGKTWQEAIGRNCLELGYEPWHAEMHDREIDQVIASKKPIRGEVPFTGTSGRRIYDYIFVPVFGATGEVEAVAGTTRDVTERKLAEEEIQRANKDLEQFAYTASHDLQEPLRSVKIYSQLLSIRYGDKMDAAALELFNFVRSGADRMEMLVRDLLAYTQTAMIEKPTSPADAAEALEASIANLAGIISETHAKVTFDPLPSVTVHSTHLQQLFQNLVSNAIKYRRESVPPEIHVSAKPDSGFWEFCVSDNGIGIAAEFREQIFGVFKRLHGADYSGTGIGLAICQRIVERYHGRIWVESEPGQGASFYFTVPV